MKFPRLIASHLLYASLERSPDARGQECDPAPSTRLPRPRDTPSNQIQRNSDDGTVLGQLIDNETQQFVAFTRSSERSDYQVAIRIRCHMDVWTQQHGAIAGFYQDNKGPRAYSWIPAPGQQVSAVNYPNAANTLLFDVNQLGAAVGSFSRQRRDQGILACQWQFHDHRLSQCAVDLPDGINDNGAVAGSYATRCSTAFSGKTGNSPASTTRTPSMEPLLTGMNNSGVIVGNRFSADHAFGFIYREWSLQKLIYPGAKYTMAGGINNNGVISGEIYLAGSSTLGYTAVCK